MTDRGSSSFQTGLPLHPLPQAWGDLALPHLTAETAPGPEPFFSIPLHCVREIAARLRTPLAETMALCLDHGIWPLRFKNNKGFFTGPEQARMLRARAAIVGCGGLGGHAALLLARLGIGALSLCDNDCFEESNLNRQALCREDRLGMNKALAAQEELRLVASHVQVNVHVQAADAATLPRVLHGADVAVDCLDSITARRLLEHAAHAAGIPFVHGTIAGREGFALLSLPGQEEGGAINSLYGPEDIPKSVAAEQRLGVPTPTPAATALMQVLLVAKVVTGKALPAQKTLWHLDLAVPELEILRY